jgi:hypothetical protein
VSTFSIFSFMCILTNPLFGSDIHPWDVLIDGSRWNGKIRLIGYVDVFFLICYSGESRFEKGIIIYSESFPVGNL